MAAVFAGCGEAARVHYSQPSDSVVHKLSSPEPPVQGWVVGERRLETATLFVNPHNSLTLSRTQLFLLLPIGREPPSHPERPRFAISLTVVPHVDRLAFDPSSVQLRIGSKQFSPRSLRVEPRRPDHSRRDVGSMACPPSTTAAPTTSPSSL